MSGTDWHVPDDELRRYATGRASPPWLWSTEAHLSACGRCRQRLAVAAGPDLVAAGWARLDADMDAPTPGWIESALVRSGVGGHTARLLAATPVLRLSWFAAVAATLALTATAASVAEWVSAPLVFLAVTPLLPLVGVAASFGPRVDPTYEIALVAPLHTVRLLLLRCAAVLSVTTVLSAAASLALPEYGLAVLGWFLPALALTLMSLALTPRLGPVLAPVAVGLGWLVMVAVTARLDTGHSVLFAPAGQLALAVLGALAAARVSVLRPRFDIARRLR